MRLHLKRAAHDVVDATKFWLTNGYTRVFGIVRLDGLIADVDRHPKCKMATAKPPERTCLHGQMD